MCEKALFFPWRSKEYIPSASVCQAALAFAFEISLFLRLPYANPACYEPPSHLPTLSRRDDSAGKRAAFQGVLFLFA